MLYTLLLRFCHPARVSLLLVVLLLWSWKATSQQAIQKPRVKFHHIKQELSNNQVSSILQDRYGFIWVGTLGGLHRFDGLGFEVFTTSRDSTSLPESRVDEIYEDRNGNLWIGTYDGICRYNRDHNNFVRYKTPNPLVSPLDPNTNRISGIMEDRNGVLWIVSRSSGLFYFDEAKDAFVPFASHPKDDILITSHLTTICEDHEGYFWIGTLDHGVKKLDPKNREVTHFRHREDDPSSLADDYISSIIMDHQHTIWIGTNYYGIDRVSVIDGRVEFIHYRHREHDPHTLGNDDIRSLFVDSNHVLWTCNENGGVNRYDAEHDVFFNYQPDPADPHSLSSVSYWGITEDRQGRIWLGSALDGLDVIDDYLSKFDYYHSSVGTNGINNNIIRAFYEDDAGNLYIATDGGGLNFFDRQKNAFTAYRYDPLDRTSIRANAVLTICEDDRKQLWIGTWQGGINILDRATRKFRPFEPGNENLRRVFNIIKDARGNMWAATYGGGVSYINTKTGEITNYRNDPKHSNSISNDIVPVVLEDHEGNVWMGTEDAGLNLLEKENIGRGVFKRIEYSPGDSNGLPDKLINHIYEDSRKDIWVATGGGLCQFRNKTLVRCYTSADGLATNHIKSVIEDNNGNLWLGTAAGISRVDIRTGHIKNYDKRDGLQPGEFSRYSVYKTRQGELLFGGTNGFNCFVPDSLQDNPYVPPVYITGLRIFNQPVVTDDHHDVLSRHITESDEITLSHAQSVFTLEFIALNFRNPEKNQYAYRLGGLEKEWNYVGDKRSATYTSLEPGEYFFQVKASNNDGVWNEEGRTLKIIVTPPFWKTLWFKLVLGGVMVGLVYLVTYLRSRRLQSRNSELEAKVNERTAQLKQLIKELHEKQDEIETTNEELKSTLEDLYDQKNQVEIINNELIKTHDELMQINSKLDERVQERTSRLVKANQELDRFVYSASHDLSAPLKSILGLIELTKLENQSASLSQHLAHMEKSVLKLEDVIRSLTQFSRNMGHDVVYESFRFDELVNEILDELKYPYDTQDVEIICDYGGDAEIRSDYLRMKIVMTNLISNAFKYRKESREGSRVQIYFSIADGHYVVRVRDNGIGIKEENQDKVFEMFYRGTTQSKGSGLGLYIVKETVVKLNGSVSLTSVPGEFTEFTVIIPV